MIDRLVYLEEKVISLTRELAEVGARALPDGWVAVPVEPTPEMLKAMNSDEWPALFQFECQEIYAAMIAARPEFPPNGLPSKEFSDAE